MKKKYHEFPRALLLAVIVAIAGCSSISSNTKIDHGFNVTNVGAEKIMDVVIQYGEVTQKFCVPYCVPKNGGGGGWFAPMPIQNEMFVTWKTADGFKHEATVLVKEKIKDINRFRRLFLEFSGAKLVVKQGASFTTVGEVGWEESPLYP